MPAEQTTTPAGTATGVDLSAARKALADLD